MIKSTDYLKSKKTSPAYITAADFLVVPHHGSKSQFLIDRIYSDIKIQKKNLKKPNSLVSFFTNLFQSFMKDEFEIKLTKYKKEFSELGENDTILDTYFYLGAIETHVAHIEKIRDYRKRQTLHEIITVLGELVERFSESNLIKLRDLEATLRVIEGEDPSRVVFCVDEFYPSINEIKATIQDKIKVLGKKLILLLRFKFPLGGRDIRQSYRNIVRIIFKNMDDQSGDDVNLFVYNLLKQHFSITLNHVNYVQYIRKGAARIDP